MAERRTWDTASERERKRAYRDRKRQEAAGPVEPGPVEPEAGPVPIPPPTPCPPVKALESYVADAVFGAELHHAHTSPHASLSTTTLADLIERAESYARWRYASVLAGETIGL